MLKALILLIEQMDEKNITRGVAKSINEMSYMVSVSSWHTPAETEFARQVYESSGRAYKGFIPKMKQLVVSYQKSV